MRISWSKNESSKASFQFIIRHTETIYVNYYIVDQCQTHKALNNFPKNSAHRVILSLYGIPVAWNIPQFAWVTLYVSRLYRTNSWRSTENYEIPKNDYTLPHLATTSLKIFDIHVVLYTQCPIAWQIWTFGSNDGQLNDNSVNCYTNTYYSNQLTRLFRLSFGLPSSEPEVQIRRSTRRSVTSCW